MEPAEPSVAELQAALAERDRQLADRDRVIAELVARVEELERRLGQNSRNSNRPPSAEGYAKPAPKSRRQRGRRGSGGQPGHPGTTLAQVEDPDRHTSLATCTPIGIYHRGATRPVPAEEADGGGGGAAELARSWRQLCLVRVGGGGDRVTGNCSALCSGCACVRRLPRTGSLRAVQDLPPDRPKAMSRRASGLDSAQRPLVVPELACAQRLDAGRVVTVERGDRVGAAGCGGVPRRVEPQPQVVGVYRAEGRVCGSILSMYPRSRRHAWRHGEGFDAEASNEGALSMTTGVAVQITLIPRNAERRVGHLNNEKIELLVGRQVVGGDGHHLNGTLRSNGDIGRRTPQAVRSGRGARPDHLK